MESLEIADTSQARGERRAGFTLLELTVAVAIIAMLVVIVAQCLSFGLQERARVGAQQAATELAANVLEEARALPFEKLDQKWADGVAIPSESADLLPDGKIIVTVSPEKGLPRAKRVHVEVRWQFEPHLGVQRVSLTTLLAPRESKAKGETP